jgi:hypothetical protein
MPAKGVGARGKDIAVTPHKNLLAVEIGPGDVRVAQITTAPETAAEDR